MTPPRITQDVRARIEALTIDGCITAAALVEDARAPDSPLHPLFEWDRERAAEKYLLMQARVILRTVRVVVTTTTYTIQAPYAVRDPRAGPTEQGYITPATLRLDPALARESLRLEFQRVKGALERVRNLADVLGLEDDVQGLIATLVRLRNSLAA